MAMTVGWGEILLRLALAAIVGLILGFNRTERGHPAGLRTMLLVSVAAAMAMIEANLLLGTTQGSWNELFRLDVMRLPLGILSGIGFIGAGTILRRGDFVRGLTTAATIWFVTVIGICFGGGQFGLGLAGAAVEPQAGAHAPVGREVLGNLPVDRADDRQHVRVGLAGEIA